MVDPTQEKGNRDRGFIKLERRLEHESVFEDAFLWKAYTWCMFSARFVRSDELDVGQFATSLAEAVEALKMSKPTVIKCFTWLEQSGYITQQLRGQGGRIIGVVKLIDTCTNEPVKQVDEGSKSNCPPSRSPSQSNLPHTTYKNDSKNEKNGDLYDGRLTKTKHEFPSRRRAAS